MIVGREEEAAARIREVREQHVGELAREGEVAVAPAALQQLDQPPREERVVVEIGRETRAAVLVRGLETPVLPQLRADEIDGARRGCGEVRPVEHARGARHAGDHQAVPRHQQLLVAARPDALLACREQLAARGFERLARAFGVEAQRRCGLVGLLGDVEVPVLAFEVRGRREAEDALRQRSTRRG